MEKREAVVGWVSAHPIAEGRLYSDRLILPKMATLPVPMYPCQPSASSKVHKTLGPRVSVSSDTFTFIPHLPSCFALPLCLAASRLVILLCVDTVRRCKSSILCHDRRPTLMHSQSGQLRSLAIPMLLIFSPAHLRLSFLHSVLRVSFFCPPPPSLLLHSRNPSANSEKRGTFLAPRGDAKTLMVP